MPSVSQAQHAMMVEELRKLESGEKGRRTDMTAEQLQEFIETRAVAKLPGHIKDKKTA